MNQSQEKALRYLTGSDNIESVTAAELQKMVDEHPYFPVAQFLLAKKLKEQNSEAFLPQVQKTALYFSNPYWLHYQLLDQTSTAFIGEQERTIPKIPGDGWKDPVDEETKDPAEDSHPITTAFTITELEAASNLAHETLVEGKLADQPTQDVQETGSQDLHPVTTQFSVTELEAASELAHETLKETGEVEVQNADVEESDAETASLDGTSEPEKVLGVTEDEAIAVEGTNTKEEMSQPEEEMAAITRDTDENAAAFLDELAESGETTAYNKPEPAEIEIISVEETEVIPEEPGGIQDHRGKINQQEEEMAAITREPGEETEEFINNLHKEESVVHDNLEEVVLEAFTPGATDKPVILPEEKAGVETANDEALEPLPLKENIQQFTSAPAGQTEPDVLENASTDENAVKKQPQPEPDEHERMFQNIKAMLDASSDEADADVENAVIPIDPYYTIDYFASQGIKLEFDPNPKDQLGQNLKKFTHWLRHMKKLGPEDATEAIRKETEADIVQIADSSNTVREVVTEAMALVLEKQGKKDKAIELYNKLSFLNPHKSAYFAHKIKNLKGI